ncbi:transcription elongation factor GreA [Candidatus Parcubacteria bacterium]|nr:MAG: transcription elongation factor GreA [Candidatus Parcubacteria bacterium]
MDKKKIFVTKEGMVELNRELEELIKVKRPDVLERVSQARAMGDLAENAEYAAAREELSLIDGRIEELSEIIKNSQIIEESHGNGKGKGQVQLGSKVTLSIGKKKEIFTLVGEWEADPKERRISHESPLGKALIGRKAGEKVEVEAPAGKVTYTIVELD